MKQSKKAEMMARDTLESTVVVVTAPDGSEVEVNPSESVGNLNAEASQALLIGRAVRAALMASEEDGSRVEVRVYYQ